MALILSAASGNFNAGATWVGGIVPTIGDEARASSGHTITISANATCDTVSNLGSGNFVLNAGVTLTASIVNLSTAIGGQTINYSAASPSVATIVAATITGGNSGSGNNAINHNGTGTLNVTGNVTAGSSGSSAHGINVTNGGTLNLTGNVSSSGSASTGVNNEIAGTINITGIVTGASGLGVRNQTTGIVTITGTVIGGVGAPGANNASTGQIRATRVRGNAFGPGNTAGITAQVGISNAGLGIVEIEQLEYGTNGMSPTSGTGVRFKKVSSNVAVFNFCDTAGAKTLVDATANAAMPAASDVRSGVSYASGAQTGSCAVPTASSVAFGVPVDNTTGTALLTGAAVATAVWGATTRSITGGTVDTLTNAPDVPTEAEIASAVRTELATELGRIDAAVSSRLAPNGTLAVVTTLTNAPSVPSAADIATQVRTELATELARVDAAVSTRLAGSAYTAPANSDIAAIKAKTDNLPASPAATGDIPSANITAIKAKTDLLNTDRLAQVSTVSTTGAQLAAALS